MSEMQAAGRKERSSMDNLIIMNTIKKPKNLTHTCSLQMLQ